MRVSVIVPVRNEARYLGRCLLALARQDVPREEHEVILVDNGSCDGSREIARRAEGVIFLEEAKLGAYAARNLGLAHAQGELIAFTDADCVPSSDWLRCLCDGMARTGAAVVLGTRRFASSRRTLLRLYEDYENAKAEHALRRCGPERAVAFTNNMAVRADVFRALGRFLEWPRGADIEFVQRCLARFGSSAVAYVPEACVTHLEISGVAAWWRKQATYGLVSRRIERRSTYRPLRLAHRLQIAQQCRAVHDYTWHQTLALMGVLGIGMTCFALGRVLGRLEELAIGSRHKPHVPADLPRGVASS